MRYTLGMSKKARQVDLAGDLRAAIAESGVNRYQLARRTGISYSIIHGFVSGERDVTLATASRLVEAVGAESLLKVGTAKKGR